MRITPAILCLLTLAAACMAAPATQPASAPDNWPCFRPTGGHEAIGAGDPPVQIDMKRDVRWKAPVPAAGQGSPIIWGDKVFLTGEGSRVMAFQRATGKLLWNTELKAEDPVEMPGDKDFDPDLRETGSAAPTAATDGKLVYAFFGSSVFGAVDFSGKQVWAQRLLPGKPRNTFGLAASPVLYGDLVILQMDMGKDPDDKLSFVAAYRCKDGVEAWKTDRPAGSSWSTPIVAKLPEGDALITTAPPLVIAYDPKTGQERWSVGPRKTPEGEAEIELKNEVAASPIVCGRTIMALAGPGGELFAIKPGGKGDVTKTHVLWHSGDVPLPDVASPVCADGRYFHISAAGDVYGVDLATGKELTKVGLEGQFWSSPVLVKDRMYAATSQGKMFIVSLAGKGGKLAEVDLGERVTSTPAILDGRIYIRGVKNLICIGRP
ncbi:MAG: PQQ-binding-like beta-propeller repeat protein [Phycisphaerae bacterium]|nr:PQQ-binding-like beta-propeller repeat protein [Phycisphaerae bacterium]